MPEAQLDRFMFNIVFDYPTYEEELNIVKRTTTDQNISLNKIMSSDEILLFQKLIRRLPINNNVLEYAVSLVTKTRPNSKNSDDIVKEYIEWGAGPRASQYMILAAKCHSITKWKIYS